MARKFAWLASMAVVLAAQAAVAETDRTRLPIVPPPFDGVIRDNVRDSVPAPLHRVSAPAGAPSVLLFMSDDVGFAMSSTFGGPVPTPNFDRLAAMGQRYNRFHTTGICSTSRAAILTGRNHHNAGVGYQSDFPAGYPGYLGRFSPQTAPLAQVLRLNGYNTAMFGKHHNVPAGENSAAGPFDNWPTGLGFEYFYGFLGGSTDQWRPTLYRGTTRVSDAERAGDALDKRLADDVIHWVHGQKSAAPDKPFLVYLAPGSTHAPHQAPADYIARFKGRFDQGWDAVREETFRRQRAAGIIPKHAMLTPRPPEIPAWDSLSPDHREFAARSMEVAAAMLAYQDAQLGRVLDEFERMGILNDTLVIAVLGDNGASAEAGPRGVANERAKANGVEETDAYLAGIADALGSERHHPNYPAGWAWAMDTPLRWTKQVVSMLGGVRNGMILAWGSSVQRKGSVCGEFGHLVDVAPTVLDAAGLPAPDLVFGVAQKPMDGRSLLDSTAQCQPMRPRTQYFEMSGKVGLYHDGWFASYDDNRLPWQLEPTEAQRAASRWTLYNLDVDFSQARDLSTSRPARLEEMKVLWREVATRNNVFPLDNRGPYGRRTVEAAGGARFEFWGGGTSIPAGRITAFSGRPFTIDTEIELAKDGASGVIAGLGSHMAGWSLFLEDGRIRFVYALSERPGDTTELASSQLLPAGRHRLSLQFLAKGVRQPADVVLLANGKTVATGRVPQTFVITAEASETFDVGSDTGMPVTDYGAMPPKLDGEIRHFTVEVARPQ